MSKYPSISVIIPTYTSSEKHIEICIKSINNQLYPRDKVEVIVVDNMSLDNTRKIAKKLGAVVYTVEGKPSQACNQINLGVAKAKGEYIFLLDHDMELSKGFLADFANCCNQKNNTIDAWYVPEHICASNSFLTKIRNFERSFYNATIIDAARIIKKNAFNKTKNKCHTILNGGPGDWDLDIQLKLIKCKFDIINKYIYHHEEGLDFWKYVNKKSYYAPKIEVYLNKWRKNEDVYTNIVSKQFSYYYRSLGIFVENGKWIRMLGGLPFYVCAIILKFLILVTFKINSIQIIKRNIRN